MHTLRSLLLLLGILAITLSGCGGGSGPETVPVTGTVLLDGNPVVDADVTFMAEGASHAASGKTDAQGKFSLKTMDKEGAVLGTHAVTIVKVEAGDTADMTEEDYVKQMEASKGGSTVPLESKSKLPAKYGSTETSGLTRTVKKGEKNDFKFEL